VGAMEPRSWNPHIYTEVIRGYTAHSLREIDRVRRNLMGLSEDDKNELVWKPEEQVAKMKGAVLSNMTFLNKISGMIDKAAPLDNPDHPHGVKPIQVLLQTVMREWSAEGEEERRDCFERLLGAVDSHLKAEAEQAAANGAPKPKVLCPGANLGRLPFEAQRRGYECSGCESRVLHYFVCEFLKQNGGKDATTIQPFVLNTCNRFKREDHVRPTPFPELEITAGSFPSIRYGDFTRLYDDAAERAQYDALVTSFAVDTSPSIFRFVRTAAHVVREGGIWANFGPLAYDTEHDEAHGRGLELSWEELRYAVSQFFEVKEEAFVDALSASNGRSMMQIQYSCIFFSAVRNGKPALGIGCGSPSGPSAPATGSS